MPVDRVCPACGGPMAYWRHVESAEPALAGRQFTLWRCATCGTAVTLEPADPLSHDSGAYSIGAPRIHRLASPVLALFDRHRLSMLAPVASAPGRLADAGAGRGRFVAAASRAGYDAFGIEPSQRGVTAGRELGVRVLDAGIEDAEIEPGSVDAVTLWHVLEHLDDPGAALAAVRRWLAPGGALLVGVPNIASWQARVCQARWFHLDVPRHRVHFTPEGLERMLHMTGFEPVRTHHVLAEHNPYGMWQSIVSRWTRQPSYLYNMLKRNAPIRAWDLPVSVAALLLTPFAALLELIAGLARRGGTIAVLARKPPG